VTRWTGWWEQHGYGRQEMRELELTVGRGGYVEGRGVDCIGEFHITGELTADKVSLLKTYLGKHQVFYRGTNSGEGIYGTWHTTDGRDVSGETTGPFALTPVGVPGPIVEWKAESVRK